MPEDRDRRPSSDSPTFDPPGQSIDEDGTNNRAERAERAERTGSGFDPTPYLRRLRGRGGQDYLDVRIRLLWLRREHPDAEILTEHVQISDASAIFKATVTIPAGGMATGYGSETASDFPDFIEKAETKAIGRALNALGYGAQFAEEERDEESGQAPGSPRAATPTPIPARRESPKGQESPAPAREDAPIDISANRDRPPATPSRPPLRVTPDPPSRPATAPPPLAADDDEDPPLEDYSWTAFWRWARPLGFQNRGAIEALIGRPITDLTPAYVRDLIREKRGDE